MTVSAQRRHTSAMVGIWVFVLSDAIGFAALFTTAAALRAGQDAFAPASLDLNSSMGWGATGLLAAVSLLMVLGRRALARDRGGAARALCALAGLLALAFVSLQIVEYRALLGTPMQLSSPAQESFVMVTGYHLLHVSAGALALGWALFKKPLPLGPLSVYWHFVDGLWLFIFSFFYLV